MGKPKRVRNKPFNYDSNRKRNWKKRKQQTDIKCAQIKSAWDKTKSVNKNLQDMGICADPNKAFKVKQSMREEATLETEQPGSFSKEHVVKALEEEASRPAAKTNKLSEPDVQFCTYMLDKHGDDYKAMARDRKNHYQETPKQIKKKINMFKNTPSQYGEYLTTKGEHR